MNIIVYTLRTKRAFMVKQKPRLQMTNSAIASPSAKFSRAAKDVNGIIIGWRKAARKARIEEPCIKAFCHKFSRHIITRLFNGCQLWELVSAMFSFRMCGLVITIVSTIRRNMIERILQLSKLCNFYLCLIAINNFFF